MIYFYDSVRTNFSICSGMNAVLINTCFRLTSIIAGQDISAGLAQRPGLASAGQLIVSSLVSRTLCLVAPLPAILIRTHCFLLFLTRPIKCSFLIPVDCMHRLCRLNCTWARASEPLWRHNDRTWWCKRKVRSCTHASRRVFINLLGWRF